ncbi:MAG: recombinase family protein [Gemmataceae bacterium]|nr:recombinase family protein [Gemmataceae bacterium]
MLAMAIPPMPGRRRPGQTIDKRAAVYARFSSDLQDASSIEQQFRKCREAAEANGHLILPALEFRDDAISGTRGDRAGLNAMLAAARQHQFTVLYVDSLSRLARALFLSMDLFRELTQDHGVTVYSVTEGFNTQQQGWELNAFCQSYLNQEQIRILAAAVLRGQEDLVLADLCVGDCPYGYRSKPLSDEPQSCSRKIRRQYMIHEQEAAVVDRIFKMFVKEKLAIGRIVATLNRERVPVGRRVQKGVWSRTRVRTLLRNKKYVGQWVWGLRQNVRQGTRLRVEHRTEEDLKNWTRWREHLRIIDDGLFAEAQSLLDANEKACQSARKENGRLGGSSVRDRASRFLLHHVLVCGKCGGFFQTAGQHYMMCRNHLKGQCSFSYQVSRTAAMSNILSALTTWLKADESWVNVVESSAIAEYDRIASTIRPSRVADLSRRREDVENRIRRLVEFIEKQEQGGADDDVGRRLRSLRSERSDLDAELRAETAILQTPAARPTRAWIERQLGNILTLLGGEVPEANRIIRQLMGPLTVTAVRVRGLVRPHLQTTWVRHTARVVNEIMEGGQAPHDTPDGEEIIPLKVVPDWISRCEEVRDFHLQGLSQTEIARQMSWAFDAVPKAMKYWCEKHGIDYAAEMRSRRRPWGRPNKIDRIRDEASRLHADGQSASQIAELLGCHAQTVRRALGLGQFARQVKHSANSSETIGPSANMDQSRAA